MRQTKYYILEGKTPVVAPDFMEWAKWIELARKDRLVARTILPGNIKISTVFLGIDHQFNDKGPPLLFETMIFGGDHDEYQERYSTWEEAERGHKKAVALVHTPRTPDNHGPEAA